MQHPSPWKEHSVALALILLMTVIRLATLNVPDLIDTTEGRYASVAKFMLERDDWVTPWIHYQKIVEPYLGKPPFHFWMIRLSYMLFGLSNFSARLPGCISELGIAAILGALLWTTLGMRTALVGVITLLSSGLFFFLSGACLLDVTLALGVTAALAGFYLADRSRLWGYLFFCGLAIGVLTKGPLAIILVGLVVAPWCILQFLFADKLIPIQVKRLPWISGSILFAVLVVPWYYLMEQRNPGFLEYFFLSENFGRFAKKDYGDRYGTGHKQLFGIVWAYMMLGLFPWSLLAVGAWVVNRSVGRLAALRENPLLLYGVLWMTTFPLLLTFARQYTPTYIAPVIPGFALCLAILWPHDDTPLGRRLATFSQRLTQALGIVLVIGAAILFIRYKATPSAATCTALLGVIVAVIASQKRYRESAASAGNVLALAAVAVYGATTVCMDRQLSEQRSSRLVLERASKEGANGAPVQVEFPMRTPFSADFYASQYGITVIEGSLAGTISQEPSLIIAQKRDLPEITKEAPNLTIIEELGRWLLLRKTP